MSDSLWPQGLYNPWSSPGQNTGVGSPSLLQGIFETQGSNPGLPCCRWILYQLSHKGSRWPQGWIGRWMKWQTLREVQQSWGSLDLRLEGEEHSLMCCPHLVGALPFQVGEGLRLTTFEFLSVWLRVYRSEEWNKGYLMNTKYRQGWYTKKGHLLPESGKVLVGGYLLGIRK